MTTIEVRNMYLFRDDDGKRPYTRLAVADVILPDMAMEVRSVALAWSEKGGYTALAPSAQTRGGKPALRWHFWGDFGKELADKLAEAFHSMGGVQPKPAPANDDAPAPYDITLPRFIIRGLPA